MHHDVRRLQEVRSARYLLDDLRVTRVREQQSIKSRGAAVHERVAPDPRLGTFAPRALEPESLDPRKDPKRRW